MWRPDRIAGIALALGLGLATGAAAAKDWTRIRIATEGAYPPWNHTDPSGVLIGFEIDLVRDLCRRLEVTCELVATDWSDLIPGLQTGRYDAIMDGLSITGARQPEIRFSDSYAATPALFGVPADSPLASLASQQGRLDLSRIGAGEQAALDALAQALAGHTVGVQVATPHARFLEAFLAEVVEVRKYPTLAALGSDLEAGRVDLGLASIADWQLLLGPDQGVDLTLIGPGLTGGPLGAGVGIGLRPEDAELAALFNRAIGAAKADGTVTRLAQRWFGYDVSP